jgi:hypothetical protein
VTVAVGVVLFFDTSTTISTPVRIYKKTREKKPNKVKEKGCAIRNEEKGKEK